MLPDAAPKLSGYVHYLLSVIVIVAIIAGGINLFISEQDNKSSTKSYPSENVQTNVPVQPQIKQEISFNGFLSVLKQDQQRVADENSMTEFSIANHDLSIEGDPLQNEDEVAQTNRSFLEAQQVQIKAEYQQIITDFNQVEGDNKVLLLQELWQLAPEVGIEENLLILLQLATHDPDEKIERLAGKILNDLIRFRDGVVEPEVQLVSQVIDINNTQQRNSDLSGGGEGPQSFESQDLTRKSSASSVEMTQQRNDKINQLTQLALNSEDTSQKDYALMNLMQFDHDSALEVIQYQLLNSVNTDERFRALEKLRADTGNVNSLKLRALLEIAANDFQASIAESAQASITLLDQYDKNFSENAAIATYSDDIQESGYADPMNYNVILLSE